MADIYRCPNCGNTDPRYIGYKNGKPFCLACISFRGKDADKTYVPRKDICLTLNYSLSKKQEEISSQVLSSVKEKKNVLIHAVTGAGKTELVYKAMEYVLKSGGHVGFATPRKDVVIDLKPRIEEAFPKAHVISVYGSHNATLEADIIVLTTHQLYRYGSFFDLLILDEIDAFPYRGNNTLISFFKKSVKGVYILLSATPSEKDISSIKKDNGIVLSLSERYHGGKLPVPEIIVGSKFKCILSCIKFLKEFTCERKPVFIFAPTIEIGRKLYRLLSLFVLRGSFVSSKEANRRIDIERFKAGELDYLVTTSILERGVTVKNLQVIVYSADHELYDKASLIQIAGRAGRKKDAKFGKVIFLCEGNVDEATKARDEINETNRKASLL